MMDGSGGGVALVTGSSIVTGCGFIFSSFDHALACCATCDAAGAALLPFVGAVAALTLGMGTIFFS